MNCALKWYMKPEYEVYLLIVYTKANDIMLSFKYIFSIIKQTNKKILCQSDVNFANILFSNCKVQGQNFVAVKSQLGSHNI